LKIGQAIVNKTTKLHSLINFERRIFALFCINEVIHKTHVTCKFGSLEFMYPSNKEALYHMSNIFSLYPVIETHLSPRQPLKRGGGNEATGD
jgi:hypothetical protein